MKRTIRALSILLMAGMILAGCSEKQQSPAETSVQETTAVEDLSHFDPQTGRGQIYTPDGLELLRQHPEGEFAIMANLDCAGMVWEPIEVFSGKLSAFWAGNRSYTISNLVISGEENPGFFSTLSGSVENLNFDGVTLETPEGFSGMAGILAASVTGTVTNVRCENIQLTASGAAMTIGGLAGQMSGSTTGCYVDGSITINTQGEGNHIGGGIGVLVPGKGTYVATDSSIASELSKTEVRTDLNVTANGGTGEIGGIYGTSTDLANVISVNYGGHITFDSPDGQYAISPLAGHLHGTISSSFSCARSMNLTGNGCEAANAFYGTAEPEKHTLLNCVVRDVSNLDETLPQEEQALRQKVVDYMYEQCTFPWIPSKDMSYSDSCKSKHIQYYQQGFTYFGQPYTHHCSSLERFTSYIGPDGVVLEELPATGWEYQFGNDCADCVYWSWSQVSPSVTYLLTNDMICQNGTIPVGSYTLANQENTADTCLLNGPEVIYEAYAQLKMGDAILEGPGHVRMVAEAAYVFRDENGKIDPAASYVLFHEQGATTKLELRNSTCQVNKKTTFEKLYTGNYIPITIPEFAQGMAGEPVVSCDNTTEDFENIFRGKITSNYRINWVRISLTDPSGSEVYGVTFYPTSGSTHNVSFDLSLFNGNVRASDLTAGQTYHYTAYVGVADGQEIPVKDYDFTV